jgi:hypothetical protein
MTISRLVLTLGMAIVSILIFGSSVVTAQGNHVYGLGLRKFDSQDCPDTQPQGLLTSPGREVTSITSLEPQTDSGPCGSVIAGTSMIVSYDDWDLDLQRVTSLQPNWTQYVITQKLADGSIAGGELLIERVGKSHHMFTEYCHIQTGSKYYNVAGKRGQHTNAQHHFGMAVRLAYSSACQLGQNCAIPASKYWTCAFSHQTTDPDVPDSSPVVLSVNNPGAWPSVTEAYHGLAVPRSGFDHHNVHIKQTEHSFYYWSQLNPLDQCYLTSCGSGSDWDDDNNRRPWINHDGITEAINFSSVNHSVDVYDEGKSSLFGSGNDPSTASEWDICRGYIPESPCRCFNCSLPASEGGEPLVLDTNNLPLIVELSSSWPTSDRNQWVAALDDSIETWNSEFKRIYPSASDLFQAGTCPSSNECVEISAPIPWTGGQDDLAGIDGGIRIRSAQSINCALNVATFRWPIFISINVKWPLNNAEPAGDPDFGRWSHMTYYEHLFPKTIGGISGKGVVAPRGSTLIHELGHVLGLGHTPSLYFDRDPMTSWGVGRPEGTAGSVPNTPLDRAILTSVRCLLDKR